MAGIDWKPVSFDDHINMGLHWGFNGYVVHYDEKGNETSREKRFVMCFYKKEDDGIAFDQETKTPIRDIFGEVLILKDLKNDDFTPFFNVAGMATVIKHAKSMVES